MKKKLNLEGLKVRSFVTDLGNGSLETVKGGQMIRINNERVRISAITSCQSLEARHCPPEVSLDCDK